MNWPWNKPEPTPNQIMERLDRIESTARTLVLEWEDAHEKIKNAMARLRKRERDAEAAEAPSPGFAAEADLSPSSKKGALWRRARAQGMGITNVR